MKHILRQGALTLVFLGLLYGLCLGISLLVVPPPKQTGVLDTAEAEDSLFMTPTKYVVLNRTALANPEKRVLLLGASNTAVGFPQQQMQGQVPCAAVNNLSIGDANISEVTQMIDLVHEMQDGATRQSDVFVIGIWYGMFVDNTARWHDTQRIPGDTDIDVERYRYGFYRRTNAGPVAVWPPDRLELGVLLIRPYLLLERVVRDATHGLRDALFVRAPHPTEAEREARVVSDDDKSDALAYWQKNMEASGGVSQAQFNLLESEVRTLVNSGERVVLVDLPLPAWHRQASPYYIPFKTDEKAMLDHLSGLSGFTFLQMDDFAAETDFSDEVHPKPHAVPIWTGRLAAVLNPVVCSAAPVSAAGEHSEITR
jgi:hypothetical protein